MGDTSAPTDTRPSTLRYLPGLDGLRAISVLAVLFFHHYFVFGSERGWMPGGFLGVEVFFVVSGYLITALLLAERRETGGVSLQHFWIRRARRLLPAVYVLLAVVVAYTLLFLPDSIATLKGDVIAALTYTSNWWQIIADRSYFVTSGRPELLKQLWSLAIEEQFYLFWPPLLMLGLRRIGRQRTLVTIVAVAAGSTVLLGVTALVSINFAYYATFTRLSGLLLGSAMAFFYAPSNIRGRPAKGARLALNVAGVFGLLVLAVSFHEFTFPEFNTGNVDRSVFFGGFLLVDLATLLVIAAVVHPVSDLGRWLGIRPLKYVGTRSYSLYLWHWPIFCVTRPRVDFQGFFHMNGWPVFVLRLVLSFGAAELSYRFVESPIRGGAIGRYRERLRHTYGMRRQRLVRRGVVVAVTLSMIAVALGDRARERAATGREDRGRHRRRGRRSECHRRPPQPGYDTFVGQHERDGHTGQHEEGGDDHDRQAVTLRAAVLAIGDSVMLGARRALDAQIPGIAVDGVVSRQVWDAPAVLSYYRNEGLMPRDVVVHLGTNGRVTPDGVDQVMRAVGAGHRVFWMTARVPRVWEAEVNASLRDGAKRWPALKVLDWRAYAGCHDDWFVNDGFHLTDPGQAAYARFMLAGIRGTEPKKCKK